MISACHRVFALWVIASLVACGNVDHKEVSDIVGANTDRAEDLNNIEETQRIESHKFRINQGVYVGDPVVQEKHAWLRDIEGFSLEKSESISAEEIMKAFSASGINIITPINIDAFSYTGYGYQNLDAETALKVVIGGMGLDFMIDDESQTITILPLQAATYYLQLEPMQSELTIGDNTSQVQTINANNAQGNNGAGGGGAGASANQVDTTRSKSTLSKDPFVALRDELSSRCRHQLQPYQGTVISTSETGGSTSTSTELCSVSVNEVTGRFTITAPRWMQPEFADYFARLNAELNTSIRLEGVVLTLNTTRDKLEGIDIEGIITGDDGTLTFIRNSVLGGFNTTQNGGIEYLADTPANNILGSAIRNGQGDIFNIFMGFLSDYGTVTTTHEFNQVVRSAEIVENQSINPLPVFVYDQETSTVEGGGAESSIQNRIEYINVGTVESIYARYDPDNDSINGTLNLQINEVVDRVTWEQFVADTTVETIVPILRRATFNTTFSVRDGDALILRSIHDESATVNVSGITNTSGSEVLRPFTNQTSSDEEVSKSWLLIRAKAIRV